MKRLFVLLALVACDKLPDRPSEATFRKADDYEKCRLTASRAILCTDELMVASLRTLGDIGDMPDAVEEDLAKDKRLIPKKNERKENIAMHKASCTADLKGQYVERIFSCWAVEDCKKFATCVYERPATPSGSGAPPPAPPSP